MKILNKVDVYHQFGARIRYLRLEKKYTIEELAFICGINNNYLSDLERGNRNPTLKIINKISNGLEIEISELLIGVKEE